MLSVCGMIKVIELYATFMSYQIMVQLFLHYPIEALALVNVTWKTPEMLPNTEYYTC